MTGASILIAILVGAYWRRWLGMAEENRHMRRPFIVLIGFALAIVFAIGGPWWGYLIMAAPVVWLILPAEASNFPMTDLISKAPWQWPHVPWLLTETDGPRPWAELFCGALGFGAAALIA